MLIDPPASAELATNDTCQSALFLQAAARQWET